MAHARRWCAVVVFLLLMAGACALVEAQETQEGKDNPRSEQQQAQDEQKDEEWELSSNAPKDKPVGTNAEQLRRFEEAIAPYVAKARETLPEAKQRFLKRLPPKHTFFITTRLYDETGRFEQVFVKVDSWRDEEIHGRLASELSLVKGHKIGEKVGLKERDLYDWTISKPDGTEEGNFVGKFLDTYQP